MTSLRIRAPSPHQRITHPVGSIARYRYALTLTPLNSLALFIARSLVLKCHIWQLLLGLSATAHAPPSNLYTQIFSFILSIRQHLSLKHSQSLALAVIVIPTANPITPDNIGHNPRALVILFCNHLLTLSLTNRLP